MQIVRGGILQRARQQQDCPPAGLGVEYLPFLKFRNPELEDEFRRYFCKHLTYPDILWSILTTTIALMWARRGLDNGLSPWYAYSNSILYIAITGTIIYLGTQRPRAYTAYRALIVLSFRIYHQIAVFTLGAEFSPIDGKTAKISKLPWDMAFISRVFRHCSFAGAVSNGYQLLSKSQLFSALVNIVHHASTAIQTCNVELQPEFETKREEMLLSIAENLKRNLAMILPLSLGDANDPVAVAPCYIFYLWALLTFGLMAPYILAINLEEYFRLTYLKENGRGILSPTVGWRVAHALACLAVGSIAIWGILDIILKYKMLFPY